MRFHGVEMVGPYWCQTVPTLPTWAGTDEGRLVYCQFDHQTYYADNTGWKQISNGTHTHAGVYLPIAGQAADSDKLDGNHAAAFAMLSGGNTFSGTQNMQDGVLQRAEIKDYSETFVDCGTGGDYTFDLENGNNFQRIVNATANYTFLHPPATGRVGSFSVFLINGGSFTVNWPASVVWPNNNTIPVPGSTTTSFVDAYTFVTFNGGTRWYGTLTMKKLPI